MFLEIDESFVGHKKTGRFCALMKDKKAAWHILRLWSWACRCCPDGNLEGMLQEEIELSAQYDLLDGRCYNAMVAAGFIDESSPGIPKAIHNWAKRTGAAIVKMTAAAERKKNWRLHKEKKCTAPCEYCNIELAKSRVDENVLSHGPEKASPGPSTNVAAPTQTRQDQTRPVQTSQELISFPPSPGARARSNVNAKTAQEWYQFFAARYWEVKGRQYGKGSSDGKALGHFSDLLETLPEEQRAADWLERKRMVDEFFAREDLRTIQAGWPFAFFATDFRGLAMPPEKRPKPVARSEPVRNLRVGAARADEGNHTVTGEIPI